MMKKYNAVLISIAPNGKNTEGFGCVSEEYVGMPMTVCIVGFSNNVFCGYNVVVYDKNMKSVIFDCGIVQKNENTLMFTTRDNIYTFSVKSLGENISNWE